MSLIFIQKIVLSLLIGALLGLEREYTKRQEIAGLRTFSLVSVLGAVLTIISKKILDNYALALAGFILIGGFALFMYLGGLRRKRVGFTTNISLIISYILGVLVGLDLFIEAIFLGVVVAVVLFSREWMHQLIKNLTQGEVCDFIEFLVLLGIIYPIIPQEVILYGVKIPLLTIWFLAVFISLLNFCLFISARYFGAKIEIGMLSFFGGFISSTATIGSFLNLYRENKKLISLLIPGCLILNGALFSRNFILVAIGEPAVLNYLLLPTSLCLLFLFSLGYLGLRKKKMKSRIKISSPFNVKFAIKFGAMTFLLYLVMAFSMQAAGAFLLISLIGGAVSSSSTSISIAGLLVEGMVSVPTGCIGLILANIGAVTADYILCYFNKAGAFLKSAKYVAVAFLIWAFSFVVLGIK